MSATIALAAADDSFAESQRCRRASRLAREATRALYEELALYPKPGLVSFVDSGSHDDMNASTFLRSISTLRSYFARVSALGAARASFRELERLGLAAERRMLLATGGVNTHRGAIFMLGMLCAAVASCDEATITADDVRSQLRRRWGADLAARAGDDGESNGQGVARQHGLHGARGEASAGFPVLFEVAVPTLRNALRAGIDRHDALLQTFFAVMAVLDDTNVAHRGGIDALRFVQGRARSFLEAGGVRHRHAASLAAEMHVAMVARRLSPGGAADVLAAAIWIERLTV